MRRWLTSSGRVSTQKIRGSIDAYSVMASLIGLSTAAAARYSATAYGEGEIETTTTNPEE